MIGLDSSGYQIAKAMHDVVLSKVVFIILKVNYVVINVDEVTIVDVQHWIYIHAYYVLKNKMHNPILLTL
jgi:hypothetical protein